MTKYLVTPILLLWAPVIALGVVTGSKVVGCELHETAACEALQSWHIHKK